MKKKISFEVRKGKNILSKHKTRKEAGRKLGKLLYNHPKGLSLVEVMK